MIYIQIICPRNHHVLKSTVACDFTDVNLANADDFTLPQKVHELKAIHYTRLDNALQETNHFGKKKVKKSCFDQGH